MLKFLTAMRGPKFEQAERVVFDLSGNRVSFLAPGYRYDKIEQADNANAQRQFDLSDPAIYWSATQVREDDRPFDTAKEADGFALFHSLWQFSKPILNLDKEEPRTVNDGALELHLSTIKFDQFGSLFIPANLEKAILFDIDFSYGPESYFGGPGCGGRNYIGPLNWKSVSLNGVIWIFYFIERTRSKNSGYFHWIAPLTDTHAMIFSFSNAGTPSTKLLAAFEDFMYQMIASCTIEYSEAVQAQIAAVAEKAAHSKISEQVAPFAWEEYDLYPEKFEFQMSD